MSRPFPAAQENSGKKPDLGSKSFGERSEINLLQSDCRTGPVAAGKRRSLPRAWQGKEDSR
jgi:hypothetical protein